MRKTILQKRKRTILFTQLEIYLYIYIKLESKDYDKVLEKLLIDQAKHKANTKESY